MKKKHLRENRVSFSEHKQGYHITYTLGNFTAMGFIYSDDKMWVIYNFDEKNLACKELKQILQKIQPKGWEGFKTVQKPVSDKKPIFQRY